MCGESTGRRAGKPEPRGARNRDAGLAGRRTQGHADDEKGIVHMFDTTLSRRSFVSGAAVAAGVAAAAGLTAGKAALASQTAEGDTYVAVEASMKGDITVFTTVSDGKIVSVQVLDDIDSPVIRDAAIEKVCAEVVECQSVNVDAASGATITSMAILSGVSDALEAAGLDAADFQAEQPAVELAQGEAEEADVVVVGAGMSGLAAAIEAARSGAKVVVLEKLAYIGGSTRVCGGGLWAMGSSVNERAGQDCSLEDYVQFMSDWSAPTELNTDLLANIREVSGATFDYLYDWGLPVAASSWTLGNPEAQLPCFWSTAGIGTAWETGNSGVADFMCTRAKQDGAEVRLLSRVSGLVVEDGKVTGVKVEDAEKAYEIHAPKVILCSGGFTRNADLIEKYAPEYADAFAFTGAGCTGDGLTMTEELGVQVVGTGMMGLFGVNPGLGYYGKYGNLVWQTVVTVNAEGETFGMEEAFYGKTLKLLLDQTDACGYGIADATSACADRFEEAVEAGYVRKYDTVEDLAAGEGIDADVCVKTVADAGLAQAPFYCITKRPLFIGSIPGLKVSANCEVLGSDDAPIEGLYAAGELIFGNVFNNAYPCSGTGVGTSCYSGTVAAKAALA